MNAPTSTPPNELVVLLDDQGRAVGTADKVQVHHADTPLHLAFSLYVFDGDGRVLVTRRALSKRTFPGVWTNSCCGHPAPGEALADGVRRRVRQELGVEVADLRLALPAFRYRAEQDGVVENEMCPVFIGRAAGQVVPDPTEVEETRWEPWTEFRAGVLDGTRAVSTWCREQVAHLSREPFAAPPGREDDLPPAAQPQGWTADWTFRT
jgi:isopentenyl-diphosphate delta-isomerase